MRKTIIGAKSPGNYGTEHILLAYDNDLSTNYHSVAGVTYNWLEFEFVEEQCFESTSFRMLDAKYVGGFKYRLQGIEVRIGNEEIPSDSRDELLTINNFCGVNNEIPTGINVTVVCDAPITGKFVSLQKIINPSDSFTEITEIYFEFCD